MKKISKNVAQFSLIAFVFMLTIVQVKANDVKISKALLQESKTFVAWVFDEKGNKMEGAIARIKGREDEKLNYGQTSYKNSPIVMANYPTNAIIVISKPGYITQEIDTKKLYKPKDATLKEFDKSVVNVKMVPVKKGGKQAGGNKKRA